MHSQLFGVRKLNSVSSAENPILMIKVSNHVQVCYFSLETRSERLENQTEFSSTFFFLFFFKFFFFFYNRVEGSKINFPDMKINLPNNPG